MAGETARPRRPVSQNALRLLCEFNPETRYTTANHVGYMPMAFTAAHPRTRIASECSSVGWSLFFFSEETRACRGCLAIKEETCTISDAVELGLLHTSSGSTAGKHQQLVVTAAPASIVEEYLPHMRWWFIRRERTVLALQSALKEEEEKKEVGTVSAAAAAGVELFLRDVTNHNTRQVAVDGQQQQQQQTAAAQRASVYTALSIFNAVSLLTSLPCTIGLEGIRLINYHMNALLWDVVVQAAVTAKVVNLSTCNGFTEELAMDAMQSALMPGTLSGLRGLLLPATDITDTVLLALLTATTTTTPPTTGKEEVASSAKPSTAQEGGLQLLNIGEASAITDLIALYTVQSTLRVLQAYALPALNTRAVMSIGKCSQLERLSLSRCPRITSLAILKNPGHHLLRLAQLDLQGCVALTSLDGLQPCGSSLRRLLLTGCSALTDVTALAALAALEELQAGHCASITDAVDLAECSHLRILCVAGCPGVTEVRVSASAAATTLESADLSGTDVSSDSLRSLAGGEGAIGALRTLMLNGCTHLKDFASLKGFPSLVRLSVASTSITTSDLQFLAQHCTRVQMLVLNGCQSVTSMQGLKLFQALRVLSLADTRLTNTSLQHVVNVPFLEMLALQGTAVTDLAPLAHAPYLRVVQGGKNTYKNTQRLVKAGVVLEEKVAVPAVLPSMVFVS